jgi:hypothetical protein
MPSCDIRPEETLLPEPQGPLVGKTYADGTTIPVKAPRRRTPSTKEGPTYVMVDTYALAKMADVFTRTEQKILAAILIEHRLGEPYALLTQADIGRRIGMKRQNVSITLKKLVEDGWVQRISPSCWSVSPYYGWRGTRSDWTSARNNAPMPNWRGLEIDPLDLEFDPETGEVR